MDGDPQKDIFNIQLNSALQHIKLGKQCEATDKFEAGYKHFKEASSKLMDLLRQETDEKRKQVFVKHLNECISSAGFLKVLIQDKKNLVKSGELKPCKEPVGLACL
jgi:hypothetical protein